MLWPYCPQHLCRDPIPLPNSPGKEGPQHGRRKFLNPFLVPQGENIFFVITNLIVTPNQRQETCAEVWFGTESRGGERESSGWRLPFPEAGVSVPSQGPGECVPWGMYLLCCVGKAGSQRVWPQAEEEALS